jgi:protein-S-isoprenylcysteine O-methyltransferase Ste14
MADSRNRIVDILYKAVKSGWKVKTLLTPVGFLFYLAVISLLVIISLWLDRTLHFPQIFPSSFTLTPSIIITSIGLLLMLWSAVQFLRARGTPVPFNPPPKLVTTGLYKYVRNPMMTGQYIFLFGVGIFFNSISLIFIFTPAFIIITIIMLKFIEEPELKKRLGSDYIEYKKRVPMFFPKFGGRKYK